MDKLVLLLIPGTLTYISILSDTKIKNYQPGQWIIIPIILIHSLAYVILSYLIIEVFLVNILENCTNLNGGFLEHSPKLTFFNFSCSIWSYLCACILGWLIKASVLFDKLGFESSLDVFLESKKAEPIMLETDDKKIYIGQVIENDSWSKSDEQVVVIRPQLSGNRNDINGDRKAHIVTSYIKLSEDKEEIEFADNDSDFSLFIPKKTILRIRNFDLRVFLEYFISNQIIVKNQSIRKVLLSLIASDLIKKRDSSGENYEILEGEDFDSLYLKIKEVIDRNHDYIDTDEEAS